MAQLYTQSKSNVFIASLDAENAFDTLWSAGLFFKLMNKIPDQSWRVMVHYYNQSRACVRYNGVRSALFSIDVGVKQGGLLPPFYLTFT